MVKVSLYTEHASTVQRFFPKRAAFKCFFFFMSSYWNSFFGQPFAVSSKLLLNIDRWDCHKSKHWRLNNKEVLNINNMVWWMCVCVCVCVILPRVSSVLFNSVCEFILLEAVICRPSVFLEKPLWSGSNTTLPTSFPDDALIDFIASSTLGIIKFSIAVITASCATVSIVVITLSTSLPTLLTMFISSVSKSTYGLLTWVGLIVSFK